MLKVGDVLDFGPSFGYKFFITKTAAETNGRSLEMEWELNPNSGDTGLRPRTHIHPQAIETYEVLQGKFDVYVHGAWKTLSTGEQIVVEKGMPHSFRNISQETTRVYNTHQPAMKFDQYFETVCQLTNRMVIRPDQLTFQALLYLSIVLTRYKDEIQFVSPPYAIIQILGWIGRLLGYRV
jgi:mannose-6-phosphate isomerase-like protein (cupin superfamily)